MFPSRTKSPWMRRSLTLKHCPVIARSNNKALSQPPATPPDPFAMWIFAIEAISCASANCNNNCHELNWVREQKLQQKLKWVNGEMGNGKWGGKKSRQLGHKSNISGAGPRKRSAGTTRWAHFTNYNRHLSGGGRLHRLLCLLGLSVLHPVSEPGCAREHRVKSSPPLIFIDTLKWHWQDRTGRTMKNDSIKWISNALRRWNENNY